jgi:hypothetical protein
VLIARGPGTALWGTGGLAWLLVTTAAYLAAGIAAFRLGERAAKNPRHSAPPLTTSPRASPAPVTAAGARRAVRGRSTPPGCSGKELVTQPQALWLRTGQVASPRAEPGDVSG